MEMLVVLLEEPRSMTEISKQMNTKYNTYPSNSSISINTNNLVELGLVEKKKVGRKSEISLTSKGEFVARLLKEIWGRLYG